MKYSLTWDLESIFPGGSESAEFQEKLALLDQQVNELTSAVKKWDAEDDKPNYTALEQLLNLQNTLMDGISQSYTFIEALRSEDVNNKQVGALFGKIFDVTSRYQTAQTILTKKFVQISDNDWTQLVQLPAFEPVGFVLSETRSEGKDLLSEQEEKLINDLSIDGFQGWSNHYDSLVAQIKIPFEEKDGTVTYLSAGQAQNKMYGDPDPAVREQLFVNWEKAWSAQSSLFSNTLNHLSGFRLANYKAHGVTDFLKKPLEYNRMKRETLDVMWKAISDNKQPFVDYLNRKAQLLGKNQLAWQDIEAPVIVGDAKPKKYPYDEGADFVVENFRKFSTKMADFAQQAFDNKWIEVEDRSGKAPGGYCSSLPESKESRIFMTYSESANEVATLAHELGHAFHSDVMKDLPAMNQQYAMNVAETASTFAELVISDATVKDAKTKEDKITLLDNKMQNALAMFMNIHARFLFESRFYEERQQGILTDERISELMEEAQKEAYQDALSNYHPTFWSSKLHFYISDISFYNFPYTFGYLFSLGIYNSSVEEGAGFEDKYIDLLKDTGRMTTEELAQKHLNVDLTKPDFWQAGISLVKQDVETFLELTEEYLTK
ncbi:M3 family oligoendopeptidase [Desemzia sp. RIT804]|uniref:M3 family oligoendopeptidase n=1 Tax=Desemzia sp. RIT 804 TaxID=2810209 RepID=UPI00194DCDE1|nr:M3 family oligoendopeptidase [Desemzia sp. RIT 804]MBM6613348.1 M3 family oligoendopeptidase [Desemzia sp. RIT 804]